jgi:hypothetical protein
MIFLFIYLASFFSTRHKPKMEPAHPVSFINMLKLKREYDSEQSQKILSQWENTFCVPSPKDPAVVF